MTVPWEQIFTIVVDLIKQCQDNKPANVRKQLRNPGPVQRLRAERAIRLGMGLSPKQWRTSGAAIMAEVYAAAQQASDEDLNELIERSAD